MTIYLNSRCCERGNYAREMPGWRVEAVSSEPDGHPRHHHDHHPRQAMSEPHTSWCACHRELVELTAQSFQVMILSVAERPERSTTVIKLFVVSTYVALTHSIEPMVSRFQAIGLSVGSG